MKHTLSRKLGVYIHWPFCVSKCPYCDFNSHVSSGIDLEQWTSAYIKELEYAHSQTPSHTVHTIFFGGGTPSLMPPQLMEKLINTVKNLWQASEHVEITFEANPTSSESSKFEAFQQAGANRVSVGIQAFNDDDLRFLGRPHNLKEGIQAIETAHKYFNRVSFDLIYARPQQTLKAWEKELKEALNYAPTHISLYQLTIEPGTAFKTAYSRGDFTLPDEHLSADLYSLTEDVLAQHNLHSYEVSNYATANEECKHNLLYWEYEDYVGVGPGAHGRLTQHSKKYATRRHRAPNIWLNNTLTNKAAGEHELIELSKKEVVVEQFLMGLRLTKGLNINQNELTHTHPKLLERIQTLVEYNLLSLHPNKIKATPEGRLKLNSVLNYLFN